MARKSKHALAAEQPQTAELHNGDYDTLYDYRENSTINGHRLIIQEGAHVTERRHLWLMGPDGKEYAHDVTARHWDMRNPKEMRKMPQRIRRHLIPLS